MSSENCRLTITVTQLSFALHGTMKSNSSQVAPSSASENGPRRSTHPTPPPLRHTSPASQALGGEKISKRCQGPGAKTRPSTSQANTVLVPPAPPHRGLVGNC